MAQLSFSFLNELFQDFSFYICMTKQLSNSKKHNVLNTDYDASQTFRKKNVANLKANANIIKYVT